ncbi:L,D-transpeptidase family protein [Pseudochelatococcus contaminans]|uniref:Murein L,D-transpeptidase YcbB/YkuD n=1 Tax=Pseudochelatococcus contaminans TaxID=1538103 RepID=A0A7W5Z6C2_9HYPH|nr:L,D-transpeptidase family protein [Pseudochelatococcus contaminans]MBB3811013.1 murein L,D-transpeptidase YcbB/YkuD [Pseudochelatococcus contaminans]
MARNGRIWRQGYDSGRMTLLGVTVASALTASVTLPAFANPLPVTAEPIVTGSITPDVATSGEDFMLSGSLADSPPADDTAGASSGAYDMKRGWGGGRGLDEIGMPLPDAPAPLDIPAPDTATFIGALLLGDTNVLGTAIPRQQRSVVVSAYEARGFAPFWIDGGAWTHAARAALAVLADAESHALTPARYAVSVEVPDGAEAVAHADIALSAAVVAYARDARGARLDRNKIGTLVMPQLDLPEADAVLAAVIAAGDGAGRVLEDYHPRAAQYHALRRKLAELRGGPRVPPVPVARLAPGPTITVGMRDERVPLIRAQLGINPVDDVEEARVYDARLADAVAAFQRERGLPGNGAVNRRTVVALAGGGDAAIPVARTADTGRLVAAIQLNMERWRWFPHDLGERHILVNVPEQDVKIVDGGRIVHRTRGIIGANDTPTPVFSDTMRYIVLNPSWYVPPSILKKQFLPGLARDPQYAAKRGYEVTRRGNTISVRQPPGPKNALGQVKFMFPNDLAIYLHDTPNRSLFQRSERALSNGCIRVENPMKLAEQVLGGGWTEDRLQRQVGGRERSVKLETPLPIHLTYFTLTVDADGKIRTLPDVYGYDQRIRAALSAHDRKQPGAQQGDKAI